MKLFFVRPQSADANRGSLLYKSSSGTIYTKPFRWISGINLDLSHSVILFLVLFFCGFVSVTHGLINYIDTKAKCRRLRKLTCIGTLRQVFVRVYTVDWRYSQSCWYCIFDPALWTVATNLLSGWTIPPTPPICVNKYTLYCTVYTYICSVCGGGGGSGPQTNKHLPQSPFRGKFFIFQCHVLSFYGVTPHWELVHLIAVRESNLGSVMRKAGVLTTYLGRQISYRSSFSLL